MSSCSRSAFTEAEDLDMLQCLYDYLRVRDADALKPKGLRIWEKIIADRSDLFKSHTAQGLASRMKRHILPNISKLSAKLAAGERKVLLTCYKNYIHQQQKSATTTDQNQNTDYFSSRVQPPSETEVETSPASSTFTLNRPVPLLGRAIIQGVPLSKVIAESNRDRARDKDRSLSTKNANLNREVSPVDDIISDSDLAGNGQREIGGNKKRKLCNELLVVLNTPPPPSCSGTVNRSTTGTTGCTTAKVPVQNQMLRPNADNNDCLGQRSTGGTDSTQSETSPQPATVSSVGSDRVSCRAATTPSDVPPPLVDQAAVVVAEKATSPPSTSNGGGQRSSSTAVRKVTTRLFVPNGRRIMTRNIRRARCRSAAFKMILRKNRPSHCGTTSNGIIGNTGPVVEARQEPTNGSTRALVAGTSSSSGDNLSKLFLSLPDHKIQCLVAEHPRLLTDDEAVIRNSLYKLYLIDKLCKVRNLNYASVVNVSRFFDWNSVKKSLRILVE